MAGLPAPYNPPAGCLLIAKRGSDAVGVVGLKPLAERIAEIKRLYVVPGARGTGLGLCLPGSLVERTTRCGSPRCRCHTDPSYLHGPYPSSIDNASSPKPRTLGGYSEDTPIRA